MKKLTPAEASILNESTILDTDDRTFCGLELNHVTRVSQRYIERVITWYSSVNATMQESGLVYAFLLTLDPDSLRRVARSFDSVEEAFDKWIPTLPDPIPEEENLRLAAIADRDTAQIMAARVEVVEKPGATPDPDAPGNS